MAKTKPRVFSITVPEEMYETLQSRAQLNHRSLSGEVNFLLEAGIAAETEELRQMLQFLYHSGGRVDPATTR